MIRAVAALSCGILLGSCACLEGRLDLWCYHSEEALGPDAPAGATPCSPPLLRTSDGEYPPMAYRCGAFIAWGTGNGLGGTEHYFRASSEKHVATRRWTEVDIYCGGFEFWYGRRITCEPECGYGEGLGLPLCEDAPAQ